MKNGPKNEGIMSKNIFAATFGWVHLLAGRGKATVIDLAIPPRPPYKPHKYFDHPRGHFMVPSHLLLGLHAHQDHFGQDISSQATTGRYVPVKYTLSSLSTGDVILPR